MTLRLRTTLVGLLFVATIARSENFSQALSPEDFAAAGLTQLTPVQLARLDALVQARQAAAVGAAATAPVRAPAKPGEASAGGGLLQRAKVLLSPGTEIEYGTLESELVGDFTGFEPGKVFVLANGQRWQVVSGSYVTGPTPEVRRVRIEPGALGSFFLVFDGVRARAKVKLVTPRS